MSRELNLPASLTSSRGFDQSGIVWRYADTEPWGRRALKPRDVSASASMPVINSGAGLSSGMGVIRLTLHRQVFPDIKERSQMQLKAMR